MGGKPNALVISEADGLRHGHLRYLAIPLMEPSISRYGGHRLGGRNEVAIFGVARFT